MPDARGSLTGRGPLVPLPSRPERLRSSGSSSTQRARERRRGHRAPPPDPSPAATHAPGSPGLIERSSPCRWAPSLPPVVVPDRDPADSARMAAQDRPEVLELSAPGTEPSSASRRARRPDLSTGRRWGELRKLGVTVSATSVRRVLGRLGLPPAPRREGPTWPEFLRPQAQTMLATDFFLVGAVNGRDCTLSDTDRSRPSTLRPPASQITIDGLIRGTVDFGRTSRSSYTTQTNPGCSRDHCADASTRSSWSIAMRYKCQTSNPLVGSSKLMSPV